MSFSVCEPPPSGIPLVISLSPFQYGSLMVDSAGKKQRLQPPRQSPVPCLRRPRLDSTHLHLHACSMSPVASFDSPFGFVCLLRRCGALRSSPIRDSYEARRSTPSQSLSASVTSSCRIRPLSRSAIGPFPNRIPIPSTYESPSYLIAIKSHPYCPIPMKSYPYIQ